MGVDSSLLVLTGRVFDRRIDGFECLITNSCC